jgi:hypothetical protein
MKVTVSIIIGCIGIFLSGLIYAQCGVSSDGSGGGGCGSDQTGDATDYTSRCQCAADPNCAKRVDTDCISECACCQAFGNIGAR